MAYTSNIPQAADNPSQSQQQILDNFNEIATAVSTNHGAFNNADQGKHTILNMVRQSLPQAAGATEGLLFAALVNGASELYYGKDTANAVQMTGLQPSTGGGTATSYSWDFVDGLSVRLGNIIHTGTSTNITFDTAFPNSAYVVLFSPQGAAALVSGNNVQNLTTTGFKMASSGVAPANSRYFYIALGR